MLTIVTLGLVAVLVVAARSRRRSKARGQAMTAMEKIYQLLKEDEEQNRTYPDSFQELLAENYEMRDRGLEYGMSASDPIRVNGPIGEIVYISRLKSPNNKGYLGHRLGSLNGLDIFEIVSDDFKDWKIIYLDMYWKTKDAFAPNGTSYSTDAIGISATNSFMARFPANFWQEALIATEQQFGIPFIVKLYLKDIDYEIAERPLEHMKALSRVLVQVRAQGIGDDS